MQAEKLSVSLPMSLVQFIESYKVAHQYKSRSCGDSTSIGIVAK